MNNATMIRCGCGTKRAEGFHNAFVQCASSRAYATAQVKGADGRTYNQNASFFCLTCGKAFRVNEIKARKTDAKCDARCTHAAGHSCECSCGGKNHGVQS